MRAVVQRVKETTLSVDGKLISKIEKGFAVYFGVKKGDGEKECEQIAKKIANLRVFEDDNGKMNLGLKDVGGEILFISQFTLLADVSHGNRPSFTDAEEPVRARELYEYTASKLRENGITVKTGVFGADMKILQYNDGPVTIIYEM